MEEPQVITPLPDQNLDPLSIDIKDEEFAQVVRTRREAAQSWYKNNKDLYDRQKLNKVMYLGIQDRDREWKKYESKFQDNLIYEGEAYIKPIALSRLPDLLVDPGGGNSGEEIKVATDELTEMLNTSIREREHRRALSLSFKHVPLYYAGVIKAVWNPKKGRYGNYEFVVVHPDNIVFDTVRSNDPQKMSFISEKVEWTIKDVLMRFPDKEKAFFDALGKKAKISDPDGPNEKEMATVIDVWETWFTWYKKREDRWEQIDGVGWTYEDLTLRKMKDPNWDYDGVKRTFVFDDATGEEREVEEQEMLEALVAGIQLPLRSKETFRNFFDEHRKPYIVVGYDQLGEMPYDETSRIEQVIPLQVENDTRGRQISRMASETRGKHVFSKNSGMDAGDIQKVDLNDPDKDLLVDGKLNEVHDVIRGEQPSAALFQEQDQNRSKVFSKLGVNDTTRGEVTTDTATTSQIARESDFGRIDDLTEETINFAAQQMGEWAMHFMRLRYTREHIISQAGENSELVFDVLHRDLVGDGMAVKVSASGVDKANRKREAENRAQLALTDPLSFFEDTEASDPEQRTERLMLFNISPAMYIEKYLKGVDGTEGLVQALQQQPVAGQPQQPGGEAGMMGAVNQEQAAFNQGQPQPQPQIINPTQQGGFGV